MARRAKRPQPRRKRASAAKPAPVTRAAAKANGATHDTLREVEQFLYREARMLDDRDFEGWLNCYAPDAEFWMPAWDDDDTLVTDPQQEISLIWYGNRAGLEDGCVFLRGRLFGVVSVMRRG